MTRRLARSVVVLFVVALALGGAALFAVNTQVGKLGGVVRKQDAQAQAQAATIAQLRRQQLASCGSAADLGSVPIPDKPAPSRLAIRLVTDNRGQWYGLGCPGSLPVPPGLAKWAAHFGVPVNGERPRP